MNIRKILVFVVLLLASSSTFAQLTISNGKHALEISGAISAYYNHRFLKDGELDKKKNRFKLRDAQVQFEGRVKDVIEYELQFDLVDMASGASDPENPGLMDAYVLYKGLRVIDIKFGYSKLPYSRSSNVPFIYSPYLQRAELVRGAIFSRRDVGVSIIKNFWKQRIDAEVGVYTGLGENSLLGDNDPSGALEYIGRLSVALPARYRFREVDTKVSPIPMFVVAVNGRYTERNLPVGEFFPGGATGEYGIKVIDGEKLTYGFDISAQYKGASIQFELHQLKATPQDTSSGLLQGYTLAQTEGFFKAGGYLIQGNYFIKPIRSIISGRYEELNLNDLATGVSKRFSLAYCFQVDGFNSMIKVQYFHINEEETSIDPLKWDKQIRIGWQYLFK